MGAAGRVLRRAGRENEAGRVLYYGHRRAARGWRRILGLVGYGYRPWLALLWAALVVAVTAGWLRQESDAIVPT